MFGYWKKLKELEEQNRDLNRRLESVEEYMYRQDVNDVLKNYSKKYGIQITIHSYLHNGQLYLVANGKDKICGLECRGNDWAEAYRQVCGVENRIKAFMYDKIKDAIAKAEKEGEKANDKE